MNDIKCNDVVSFLEEITIKCLVKQIKSILVHGFGLLTFYNDERTSLSELSSSSSNIVGSHQIKIYFENLEKFIKLHRTSFQCLQNYCQFCLSTV